MTLHDQITDILASAVEDRQCAGINVLVCRHGEEILVRDFRLLAVDGQLMDVRLCTPRILAREVRSREIRRSPARHA